MPKGQQAKRIRQAKKQMLNNKSRFIKNNPHHSIAGKGDQQRQAIYHHIRDFVMPQLDNDRDKIAVQLIFKLVNIDKAPDDIVKGVIQQNLHIKFVREMWEMIK